MAETRDIETDIAVIGAGPAGASAAIEAAELDLRVVILDEQAAAGGQVWRAKGPAIRSAPPSPESAAGDRLRRRLDAAEVTRLFSHRAWQLQPAGDDWSIHAAGPDGPVTIRARRVILATGAQERVFPVPGWTLPGVIGLAAATALMKGEMMLPGSRVLVAGAGPLLPYVAHEIHRHGGEVVAVADLNGFGDWLRLLPAMLRRPDLALRGAGWLASLRRAAIPYMYGTGVRHIAGDGQAERVEIGPVDIDWAPANDGETRSFEIDAVVLGHGLSPAIEPTRMLDCRHVHDPATGGWRVDTDEEGRTSIVGILACGDGAGILGVAAAPLRGRIAARAAATDLGRPSPSDDLKRELATAAIFGQAMTSLTIPRPGILAQVAAGTIVCRCEGLTRADIEAGITGGGISPNALKSETRCGMGPCGGRFCREAAAMLTAHLTGGSVEEIGLPTARPPLRPLPVEAVTGDFDYAELPIPAPAPL
jgi:thioredoxin reductase/bacterioferritin-associated ferredoxin